MHAERQKRVSDQEFFVSRILNQSTIFAKNVPFIFAAVAFIEQKQLFRNISVQFQKGKIQETSSGLKAFNLEEAFSVFDNIKGTPKYWRKAKKELYARLDNFGPFQFFFTLSCAEMRWPEIFTTFLHDHQVEYRQELGKTNVYIDNELLDDFLSNNIDKYKYIKENIVYVTILFNNRVQNFIKHIMLGKNNPMAVKYYSYKTEFQARGAPHIHGVIWVDFDLISKTRTDNKYDELQTAFKTIKNGDKLSNAQETALSNFADEHISCSLMNSKTRKIVSDVNIHHHSKSCKKHGTVCRFKFPKFPSLRTIIVLPAKVLFEDEKKRKNIVKKCQKLLDKVKETLQDSKFVDQVNKIEENTVNKLLNIQDTIALVQCIMEKYISPITLTESMFEYVPSSCQEYVDQELELDDLQELLNALMLEQSEMENIVEDIHHKRLMLILEKSISSSEYDSREDLLKNYEFALKVGQNSYGIVYKRTTSELYVNHYNQEWIQNWNGNMDIQICLDFFSIITYISEYYSKDETGTSSQLMEALKNSDDKTFREKLRLVANTFLTHRQLGVPEAIYRYRAGFIGAVDIFPEPNEHSSYLHNEKTFLFGKIHFQ